MLRGEILLFFLLELELIASSSIAYVGLSNKGDLKIEIYYRF